ncbi:hypothetical protein ACERK3_08930 [Phycisphaerales bacterium AB-hyl4]|uniref:Uncharacterized protein n=1 Tax=Natronomicrosphaera hydrolytica TaxID=3242702 RepID=A0ABV4U7D8_9BACT
MEENRTRRALDELADLFLTGPTGGPPSPVEADEPADADQADADRDTPASATKAARHPRDAETVLAEFDLEGPAPIRLPPKTGPVAPRPSPYRRPADDRPEPRASRASSPAAPSLRLHRDDVGSAGPTDESSTDDADDREARLPVAAPASVEAVLLGNLPGLSGPWLTQYAQRLAQREGPVLLLHLDEQGLDMEMVEPTDRPQPPGRVPPGGQARDLVDRLETLIRLAPHPVRRVLVHVEASPNPMVLAKLRCLDAWTLLTGADDAATVAGYRLLKRMIETDPAATPRRVGVMMMGSDDESACRGIARLRSAAASFLDTPIELVGSQRQMVPVNLRQLGRFEPMQTLWPSLRRWLAGLDPAEGRSGTAQAEPTHAESADVEPADDFDSPDVEPADFASAETEFPFDELPSFDEPTREPELEQTTERVPERTAEQAPRQSTAREPQSAAEQPAHQQPAAQPTAEPAQPQPSEGEASPDLAAFLTGDALVGGMALEARCPHQPDTQLLLDQDGRLHLLRRHAPAADRTAVAQRSDDDLPALRRALIELLEARAWVREHVELLQLTQRQCRFDRAADPVLHLFTHRADLANALTARLGPMLKLHLLQKVGQAEHATWFSTPLN